MTVIVTDDQLPDLAAPAPRNQVLVGTALAAVAGLSLIGGMLGVWVLLRQRVVDAGGTFPLKYHIPQGAGNLMFFTVWMAVFFAIWAFYAGRKDDRGNTALALAVVGVLGIAFINAQAFAWWAIDLPIAADYYGPLFYAVTATMVAIAVAGVIYSIVTIFTVLTGRVAGSGSVAGHAIYWLFTALAYTSVWSVVYIAK